MQISRLSFVIFFICLSFASFSQKEKVKFHSINSVGITFGQSGGYTSWQTINGIGKSNWFAGAGFGRDYYPYKTYPVFFDVRQSFDSKNRIFGYGDIGYNFAGKNRPGKEVYYYDSYHFSGGAYFDLGVAYKIAMFKKSSIIFSGGYSYKKINNKVGVVYPCLVGPCPVDYSKFEYGYGRVVLKAGVDFCRNRD